MTLEIIATIIGVGGTLGGFIWNLSKSLQNLSGEINMLREEGKERTKKIEALERELKSHSEDKDSHIEGKAWTLLMSQLSRLENTIEQLRNSLSHKST